MKKIGITGGIGSGKTTVCKIFESLDVPIYYADAQAKRIMASSPTVKQQLKTLLGNEAYFKNGKPDRKYISSKIFTDKSLLSGINNIVHPAVHADAERWMEKIKAEGMTTYIIKEAALLVETGSYKALDALIVVACPEETRIKRVMARDKLSHSEVLNKIKNQLPESEKIKVADFVIINDGTKPLISQVWQIHKKLTKNVIV
jgi:dephospho-CoA kinase